jgi:hypothetical protein
VPVDDGFEATGAGQQPALATVISEGRGDSIQVTGRLAASGRQCLEFTDAPALEHVFNPHLFYSPHFRRGRVSLRFDLRLEPGAVVAHEWRDGASPYHVGPSLVVRNEGQLFASGKPVAKLPVGEWILLEIKADLADGAAAGTYQLTVTQAGEDPAVFERLPCQSPDFKRLEWLGFVSLAATAARFQLDNVVLKLDE